jgi:alkanesulfonate monooxygenase SsuD/methylene tetrahydromethanopterin reductase-like flavin-dependent oxidoreductase (luciferase family)
MSAAKRIHLYALKQSTVGHTAVGLWRHPNSQAARYKDLDYWVDTAKTLEQGRFDGLFIADALGVLDVYAGSADETLRHGVQTPTNDPLMSISAMAAATSRLGFAVTVSTSYELPYAFARKMTTLDHLSKGRIGWNIVTSALESAARNLGLTAQIPHDERYAIAEEFMEVVYRLWESTIASRASSWSRVACSRLPTGESTFAFPISRFPSRRSRELRCCFKRALPLPAARSRRGTQRASS